MSEYNYSFRFIKQTSNNDCFEISVNVFNIINKYVISSHSLGDVDYCIIVDRDASNHGVSFNVGRQHTEVEISTSLKTDVKCFSDLSKIKSLASLSVAQSQYSAADLNKIKKWCSRENVKFISDDP